MRLRRSVFSISIVVISTFGIIWTASATSSPFEFKKVEPVLQIDIPTLKFSDIEVHRLGGEPSAVTIPWIGDYIAAIYRWAIPVGAILATVVIMIAGIIWLTSGGAGTLSTAKEWITNAVIGLLLLIGSYVVLNIINPDLVRLAALRVQLVTPKFIEEELEDEFPEAAEGGQVVSGDVCNSIDECRRICAQPPGEWPVRGTNTPDLATLSVIPKTAPGLECTAQDCIGQPAMASALLRAGELALAAPGGPYTIRVTSAFRPLRRQIALVCEKIRLADAGKYDPAKLGVALGWPGNPKSGHGRALGLDIALLKGGSVVSCSGCYDNQSQAQWKNGANALARIMFQAGFKRYCKEIWHFEYSSTTPCRSNHIPENQINVISCGSAVCVP